jgi:hypothetical protein
MLGETSIAREVVVISEVEHLSVEEGRVGRNRTRRMKLAVGNGQLAIAATQCSLLVAVWDGYYCRTGHDARL